MAVDGVDVVCRQLADEEIGISIGGGSVSGAVLVQVRVRRNRMEEDVACGEPDNAQVLGEDSESEKCALSCPPAYMVYSLGICSLSPFSVGAISALAFIEYWMV